MTRIVLLVLALGLASTPVHAATALFSLAIGYNGLPTDTRTLGAGVLSFADDDALAVHELARTVARRSVVLTIPDRATQVLYPSSREARPPSVAELRRALAELGSDIERATRAGDEVAVWFFYSGHGWLDDNGRANLTLADGALSQDMLYDEVLPALPGRTVHLMIDACHAEALIRPRDVTAETVEVSASEVASISLRGRLAHLPNVGVMMASASSTQAHEWDDYQTGVFTHELLYGLRGGADVNGDGRVEYSEIAAFLAAANREVTDPRARLTTLVVAPKLYPRVAIVDTRGARNVARLQGRAHHLGRFRLDDERGNRLLDLRAESGFAVDVVVPAGESILLSNQDGEATINTSTNRATNIEELSLGKGRQRSRSAVVESMRRGLFAAEFGPSYYEGFVDNADRQMIPVDMSPAGVRVAAGTLPPTGRRSAAWSAFAVGAVSLAASGVFAVLAARAYGDFQDTNLERHSIADRDRYQHYGVAALSTAAVAALSGGLGY
ncbi:MAG TPA: caspase family protein, partial [Polyangia bacterium]